MKTVKVGSRYKLVPHKQYVFNKITNSIKQLASRPRFFDSYNAWRSHFIVDDKHYMTDVRRI